MYQEITFGQFCDAFHSMDRDDSFTYAGKRALFDWLEELGVDCGEPIELDVIGLCCDFCEYESAMEVAGEYGETFDDDDDAIEWLRDETVVIEFDGGIIIQGF